MALAAPPLWRLPSGRGADLRGRDLAVVYAIVFVLLPIASGFYFAAASAATDPFSPPGELPVWLIRSVQQFTLFHAAATAWGWPAALLSVPLVVMLARRDLLGLAVFVALGLGLGALSGLVLLGVIHRSVPDDLSLGLGLSAAVGVFFSVQVWLLLLLRRSDLFLRKG